MLSRYLMVLGLAFSFLVLLACPDEEFVQLAPRIQLDVCKQLGIEACQVDFGTVALSTRVIRDISISNPSNVVLNLQEPVFSPDSDPAFRVEHWPDKVGKGLSSTMQVSYRPLLEAPVRATLLLASDAVNLHDQQPVEITLLGQGIDSGVPQIEVVAQSPCQGIWPGAVEPANLGITGVDNLVACTFEIFNHGTQDLVIEHLSFAAGSDPGFVFVGRVPGIDPETGERFESTIPPPEVGSSSSRSFVVRASPPGLGLFRAEVLIDSNDPGCIEGAAGSCADDQRRAHLRLPLMVEGAHTPSADARILSVNGDSDFDPRRIEPLDDVALTGEGSLPSSRNLRLVSYHWEIINQPVGSHGFLDDPSSVTPRFVFDNSRNIVAGVDIAGFWEVRLTVTDSRGASSVNEAVVSFNAIPTEAIHIQLVWDHPNSDVDLHLLRELPDGRYERFSDDDCYFGNCKVSGNLEWFANDPEANPSLDVDDLYGYGPENINIKTPRPGRYLAAVHYWSDHGEGDTVAVLRLFVFGSLHSEYLLELSSSDWWQVATIEWPSREVTADGTLLPDVSGF